jgi:hypothetical protein
MRGRRLGSTLVTSGSSDARVTTITDALGFPGYQQAAFKVRLMIRRQRQGNRLSPPEVGAKLGASGKTRRRFRSKSGCASRRTVVAAAGRGKVGART